MLPAENLQIPTEGHPPEESRSKSRARETMDHMNTLGSCLCCGVWDNQRHTRMEKHQVLLEFDLSRTPVHCSIVTGLRLTPNPWLNPALLVQSHEEMDTLHVSTRQFRHTSLEKAPKGKTTQNNSLHET